MKRWFLVVLAVGALIAPMASLASKGDLILLPASVRFSTNSFLEGRTIRMYATVDSGSTDDLKGVVRFYDGKEQMQGDQPVSILAGREDAVFVDWKPDPGDHTVTVTVIPFDNEGDNAANNSVTKAITVLADTDRDGIPNRDDQDDDNDGTPDTVDAFPLNKNESLDSDGDGTGNNKDEDDDNDGVKDAEDALPLNANETIDTDKDGIGNNEDTDDDGDGVSDLDEVKRGTDPLKADTDGDGVNDREDAYPLDPTQARDYDRDGIGDAKDPDADNDGIPKEKDVNDTNLGPIISITTDGEHPTRIVFPNETVSFETTTSEDPDGKIQNTEWTVQKKKLTGERVNVQFPNIGFHTLTVKLTDDKGESREKSFTLLVTPPFLPWLLIAVLFVLLILAIFLLFSYSKRRRSRWQTVHDTLDSLLKWLPNPKRKSKKKSQ